MIANEFVAICLKYGLLPSLVAEDMRLDQEEIRSIGVDEVRKFIEDNY